MNGMDKHIDKMNNADNTICRRWAEGDPLMEEYHDSEWCRVHHDDRFEFQMLCLEGASTGLSWRTILHKREAYKKAFHDFDISRCASMSDEELSGLMENPGIIRNRNKIFSVRANARAVLDIQKEYGSFDSYIWSFTGGKQIDGKWERPKDIPTQSDVSVALSRDLKKRGVKFAGPVITYSFLQAVGIVNDHLKSCPYRQ